MFARISLKQPLRGLAGDKKRTSGECDGNGQKRVVDYLRAKGQYPVNWNAGHTVQSNGWWRRETSSGVFLRNPQTGETFVERVTVSDCPTCDNTINPAELIFGAEPLPLETPLTINRAIPITSEYDVRTTNENDVVEGAALDDWMMGVMRPTWAACPVESCYPFGWTESIVNQENAKFMTLWARTNMPDQFDHAQQLLSNADLDLIRTYLTNIEAAGEGKPCFNLSFNKTLPMKGNWVRRGSIKNDKCLVGFNGGSSYIYTYIVEGLSAGGQVTYRDGEGYGVCGIISIIVTVPGEPGLQYAMEGAKYIWDNGLALCDPLDILPPLYDSPDNPDNPINPSGPKVPKPPSGDCPCKDLLRRYGLNGIANLDDPDTELLLEWY
jgi:hypothetical protein